MGGFGGELPTHGLGGGERVGVVRSRQLTTTGPESGRPARGVASRRQRPRDWEGGEPDVGHGV